MLPARYRMRRSTDFSAAVKYGIRAVQPDIILHGRDASEGPRIGLIVAKSVGSAVDRHRIARRLRHVVAGMLSDLDAEQHLVIRARPSSRYAVSAQLQRQLRCGLKRIRESRAAHR